MSSAGTEKATRDLVEPERPDAGVVRVVLPAYNEQENLCELLDRIFQVFSGRQLSYEVFVVDDGCTDDTAFIASQASFKMPMRLIRHESNRGLAAALRTGLKSATEVCANRDTIITMDADNSHPPELIDRMLQSVREGYDVVIASRFRPGARVVGVPFSRKLFSWGAYFAFKLILPIRGVRDYTCGFRAYRPQVLREAFSQHGDAFISEKGFSCMVDILLKLRHQGWVMGEVPVVLRYDQKRGASKMKVIQTIIDSLALIFRRRMGSVK